MAGIQNLEGKNGITAVKMMKATAQILDKIGIKYVLEAGTLLGVVRENRLLPWDNDVDFTITKQYEDILVKNIWRFFFKGYIVKIRRYKQDLKLFKKGEIRIIKISQRSLFTVFKKNVTLEIFIKKKIGDEYYWTVDTKNPVLKAVPERFYDNQTKYFFEGMEFSVPEDYIGYLVCHYGENWRTPIKEWNFRTDDCSVKEIL